MFIWFYLILGIFIGFIIEWIFKFHIISKVVRFIQLERRDRMIFLISRLGLIVCALFLLYYNSNWSKIIHPDKNPANFAELQELLLTKLNIQLMGIGFFIILLLAVAYVINLVFISFDRLNIFGLGYQKKVENQAKIAKEALKTYRKIETLRMILLKVIGSDQVFQRISPLVHTDSFNLYGASLIVAEVIEESFRDLAGIDISADVVSVENGLISRSNMSDLPEEIKYVIKRSNTSNKVINDRGQIMAIPLRVQESDNSYCILCLRNQSSDFVFDMADQLMIENAWAIILKHVDFILEQTA